MGASDENNRGSVREKARLRSSLEEPSSGYSFHDESRVDTVRNRPSRPMPSVPQPANDTKPRVGKATMVGGFAVPSADESGAVPTRPADASTRPKKALSEPPEVGSWPPMPSVPPEFEGAADAHERTSARERERASDFDTAPTDPPRASGGAIWEAVPSVMQSDAPEPSDAPAPAREAPASAAEPSAAAALSVERPDVRISYVEAGFADPQLARLDRIVERGAWDQLAKEIDGVAKPSPALALLRVLAKRELVDDKAAAALTGEAISVLAALLEVPESSATALMLAKRLLRRHRAQVREPASAGLSAGVLFAGLAVGVGVGWLVTKIFL